MTDQEMQKPMTPEEAAAMQKEQCIFCKIASGEIPSKKVYEDDVCVAILDINPANPGHVLVLPKEHHPILPLMPEPDAAHLFKVAKKISKALISGLKADSTNVFVANGAAAGQKAPHVIIHVIPRKANDGVMCFALPSNEVSAEDQQKLVAAIKGKVNEQFGLTGDPLAEKEPVPEEEKQEEPEPEMPEEHHVPDLDSTGQEPEGDEKDPFNIPEPHDDQLPPDESHSKKKFDLDQIGKLLK